MPFSIQNSMSTISNKTKGTHVLVLTDNEVPSAALQELINLNGGYPVRIFSNAINDEWIKLWQNKSVSFRVGRIPKSEVKNAVRVVLICNRASAVQRVKNEAKKLNINIEDFLPLPLAN